MGESPPKAPGEHGTPLIPRDLPDQQSRPGEDPLDIPLPPGADTHEREPAPTEDERAEPDAPATGETGDAHGRGPVPEEPTG